MADFGLRFFLCNILICAIICIFFVLKYALKNYLTSRMQFNLWFLLFGLLLVPFIPFRLARFGQFFLWLGTLKSNISANTENTASTGTDWNMSGNVKQMDSFALSANNKISFLVGIILFFIWITGIIIMLLLIIKAKSRLNVLKKSALPLQSKAVYTIYNNCLKEVKIKKNIPVYSTTFLKSPVITGLYRPCIYLPVHLVSDFNAKCLRYILLHELQHYKHKDNLAGLFINLFSILYWFNPFVWYALKEIQNDRETACDTSVLELLEESEYKDYGNALIDFAEKISLMKFPFTSGISGSMKQMRQRIINISSYKKPCVFQKLKSFISFIIITFILLELAPMLSIYTPGQNKYNWNVPSDKISTLNLSSYFNKYTGSFVLYNLKDDIWSVYNKDQAILRISPDSTYKIYNALFGLEEGIITPDNSFMEWDGTKYPFKAWNTNQDLYSAMQSSVNWYFQQIDKKLGQSVIQNYIKKTEYGNGNISQGISHYWMQSSLKISPVEQVMLLIRLYNNSFNFTPENINAIKDSICLFSSGGISFYGKTGTGRADGKDINGWFIGCIETGNNTYFFATNIQNNSYANGNKALEITKSILSNPGILK